MAEYGVSPNTVRRAYRLLVDAGRVVVHHGAGAQPKPR
jgi:DNA-binding GntR family transcriptional regulator